MLARPCVILSAKFRCACTGVPRDAVHFKALLELHTLLPFRFLRLLLHLKLKIVIVSTKIDIFTGHGRFYICSSPAKRVGLPTYHHITFSNSVRVGLCTEITHDNTEITAWQRERESKCEKFLMLV